MKVFVNCDNFTYRGRKITKGNPVDLSDDLAKANLELGTVVKDPIVDDVKEKPLEKVEEKKVEEKKPEPKAKKPSKKKAK